MSNIDELITEYAAVTGRPVATISVSEYIELKRYSEEDRLLFPVNRDVSKEVVIKESPIKETPYEADTEENKESVDGSNENNNTPITSPLMLMRSIKG